MPQNFMILCQANVRPKKRAAEHGFSILEMLIASVILMFGIVGVVQLVPASLQLNANNRLDTLATVIAQRELDQMLSQPLGVNTFLHSDGRSISLGGTNTPGAPVVQDPQTGAVQINFGADPVDGFFIAPYVDPSGATFDLRW